MHLHALHTSILAHHHLSHPQAAADSTKTAISNLQQRRSELRKTKAAAREDFIAACGALDDEAELLLSQLRAAAEQPGVPCTAADSGMLRVKPAVDSSGVGCDAR